jgi:hypothetical protein
MVSALLAAGCSNKELLDLREAYDKNAVNAPEWGRAKEAVANRYK